MRLFAEAALRLMMLVHGRTRIFPSVPHARAWTNDHITVEHRGRNSLRRFLLALDTKEVNEAEGRAIAQILELVLGSMPTPYALSARMGRGYRCDACPRGIGCEACPRGIARML